MSKRNRRKIILAWGQAETAAAATITLFFGRKGKLCKKVKISGILTYFLPAPALNLTQQAGRLAASTERARLAGWSIFARRLRETNVFASRPSPVRLTEIGLEPESEREEGGACRERGAARVTCARAPPSVRSPMVSAASLLRTVGAAAVRAATLCNGAHKIAQPEFSAPQRAERSRKTSASRRSGLFTHKHSARATARNESIEIN